MEETQKEKQAVPEPIDIITLLHDVLRGVKKLWWACLLLTRRGFVVHGKARVSSDVPRGGFVHGRHRQRGKRRVQLRVLLQHRHGFAARAHVPVHTRK